MMRQQLTIPALRALRRILRAADLANRQLAAATGLTLSQLMVLQEVADRERASPGDLSAALHFSHATITNICDRLGALGMIARERDPADKRRVAVSATAKGLATIEAAPDQLQDRFGAAYASLPEWEQAMILAGLERLGDALGIEANDAAPLLDSGPIDRLAGGGA